MRTMVRAVYAGKQLIHGAQMMNTTTVARLNDWHPAYVVAELKVRGHTLSGLGKLNGYSRYSLKMALQKPWPKAEAIIAAAIGVHPAVIWPTRYGVDGKPNRQIGGVFGARALHAHKDTATDGAGEVETRKAA